MAVTHWQAEVRHVCSLVTHCSKHPGQPEAQTAEFWYIGCCQAGIHWSKSWQNPFHCGSGKQRVHPPQSDQGRSQRTIADSSQFTVQQHFNNPLVASIRIPCFKRPLALRSHATYQVRQTSERPPAHAGRALKFQSVCVQVAVCPHRLERHLHR